MSASLQDVITQISFSAEHVAASAEELTASVQQANDATDQITIAMEQVSGGAESQSQGVEEGAATLQQVNTAIQDVNGSAESISISSLHARERAKEGKTWLNKLQHKCSLFLGRYPSRTLLLNFLMRNQSR